MRRRVMRSRGIDITGRIRSNNVIVRVITTSDLSPLLLLMVLTLTLVNFLSLMLVDHPTSTRAFESTFPGELRDTRMLRRPQILSRHAHTTMLKVSSRCAAASADAHPEQTKIDVEEE